MNELDFIPVRGKESDILKQSPQLGFFCVATDTGKIYLDVQDNLTGELVHKPIGGSGATILYATATLTELPNGEVWFTKDQLENSDASVNLGDLIINKDGKFLKVTELSDETITCSVIAVSGTGGGGTEGPATNGSAKIEYIGSSSMTVLKGSPCVINFRLIAVDAAGDPVNVQGTATWAIGSVWLKDNIQRVKPGDNFFDIGPYLSLGTDQTVTVKVEINTGGEVNSTARKNWNVSVVDLYADWDYNMRTINDAKKDTTITWTSFGAINKVAKILVDGVHSYEKEIGKGSNISTDFTIPGEVLTHGYHTVSLHLEADLNGKTIPSDTTTHEMIFVDKEDSAAPPVIALGEVPSTMQQYNTLFIPIVVYDHSKVGSTVDVTYYEFDIPLSGRAVDNGSQFSWNYTPSDYGYRKLTVESGVTKRNIDLEVEKIDLGSTAEVSGYAFKLKASDFSGNEDLQRWKIGNEPGLEFSEGFDWVNGGLKSELDAAGNTRSYINVRAGNRMTIKYEPFHQNVTDTIGKCFKFIFKVTQCRDYDAEAIRCYYATESGVGERGIKIGAQRALFKSSGSNVTVPYCEDTYIELEFDVTNRSSSNKGYYITTWIDGVPSGIVEYSTLGDNFDFNGFIEVGSDDADVQVYLIKTYEKHLTDTEHLSNFIMDAPNAAEMMARFVRNDILDERGEIDYRLLAQKNPDCRVHCYRIPRMTLNKDDKVKGCDYMQFHGSNQAVVTASGVTTRVQGTSSAAYGIAAFNLDAKFENGFDYPDGSHTDKWAMDENAIPVNYLTTKVNVASCENANNSLNQEWYNRYQPYRSPNREKNPKARDCMQFYPGVLFILDENQETSHTDAANGVKNNVFCDTEGYVQNPYYKLYAVCNMGNSKKNTEVFHDESNPLECCIEVADNQNDVQKMIKCQGLDTFGENNVFVDLERLFDEEGNDIDITYSYTDEKTGETETRTKTAYALWRAANMSKAAFEFRYPDEFGDNEGDSFEERFPEQARTALIGWFNFVKWFADNNPAAATNEPLPEPVRFDNYTFRGDKYSSKIGKLTVSTFAGTYETDSEKYRMAKMLNECEDHLVMDSVMFHYLFIERHTMIDNVAKNTFWSSADATHWDLTKNYDNDTADGNDNQGKLTLTYGLEPGDQLDGVPVFNGPGSVWLEFARRLTDVAATLFRALESTEYGSAWNSKTYLKAFEDWQAAIPERCWIEAYRRLYIRPNEVYKENAYLSMLEGGKKTGQRRQYETYQDMYISSKYFGNDCQTAQLIFRPNASDLRQYELPMKMYSDCYVLAGLGQGTGVGSINYSRRTKRGEVFNFVSPVDNLVDATGYLYPSNYYQEMGHEEKSLNVYNPDQLAFNGATKLNKLVMGYYEGENTKLNTSLAEVAFGGNTLLEELYAVGYMAATKPLDLTSCLNLHILDARKSSFTQILLPDSAPITQILLEAPQGLVMSNLNKITEFEAGTLANLETLRIDNIDDCPGINSLEILKARYDDGATDTPLAYNMQNVDWVENNSARINSDKIDYLEFLRSKKPVDAAGNEISTKAALTGKLIITGDAYNTNASDNIYNEYCNTNENGFGNLDIEFTGADAKMPKITILNQSGEPVWSRRIKHANTGFDANFFKTGPMGAFQVFTSNNTLDKTYTFENKYKISGVEYDADANGYPVYANSITEDLIIEPVFTFVTRQYEVTIKNFDGTELLREAADYGTPLATLACKISTPQNYVYTSEYGYEDISDNFYLCWKFEGYKIGGNSIVTSIENLEKITVSSDVILTAAFKKAHVYDNPLGTDLIKIDSSGFVDSTGEYDPNDLEGEKRATFRGRITIPHTINRIKVQGLNVGFLQNGYKTNTNEVTAIFFQPIKYSINDNLEAIVEEYQNNIKFYNSVFATQANTVIEMPLFNNSTLIQGSSTNFSQPSPIGDGISKTVIFVPGTTVIPSYLLNNSSNRNIDSNIDTIMTELVYIGTKGISNCGNIFSTLPSSTLALPKISTIGAEAFNGSKGDTLQVYFGGTSTDITFEGPIMNSTWSTVSFDDNVTTLSRIDGSTDPILVANNISCPAAISDFVTNNMVGSVSTTA